MITGAKYFLITRDENFKVDIAQYQKEWLPAVELKGEGIFIRLNREKVLDWMKINNHRYDRMKIAQINALDD